MEALKVKELIKILQKQNPEALVGLSTDSEGNEYSLMPNIQCISKGYMKPELGAQDQFFDEQTVIGKEAFTDFFGCHHNSSDYTPTIILWPSN